MTLKMEVTSYGRTALQTTLNNTNTDKLLVGAFRVSDDWFLSGTDTLGTGATEISNLDDYMVSSLRTSEYINLTENEADGSTTFYCETDPTNATTKVQSVALFFRMLTLTEQQTYEDAVDKQTVMEGFVDSIVTTDQENIFAVCWFNTTPEALHAGIFQQIMAKFKIANDNGTSVLFDFDMNWRRDLEQTKRIENLESGLDYSANHPMIQLYKPKNAFKIGDFTKNQVTGSSTYISQISSTVKPDNSRYAFIRWDTDTDRINFAIRDTEANDAIWSNYTDGIEISKTSIIANNDAIMFIFSDVNVVRSWIVDWDGTEIQAISILHNTSNEIVSIDSCELHNGHFAVYYRNTTAGYISVLDTNYNAYINQHEIAEIDAYGHQADDGDKICQLPDGKIMILTYANSMISQSYKLVAFDLLDKTSVDIETDIIYGFNTMYNISVDMKYIGGSRLMITTNHYENNSPKPKITIFDYHSKSTIIRKSLPLYFSPSNKKVAMHGLIVKDGHAELWYINKDQKLCQRVYDQNGNIINYQCFINDDHMKSLFITNNFNTDTILFGKLTSDDTFSSFMFQHRSDVIKLTNPSYRCLDMIPESGNNRLLLVAEITKANLQIGTGSTYTGRVEMVSTQEYIYIFAVVGGNSIEYQRYNIQTGASNENLINLTYNSADDIYHSPKFAVVNDKIYTAFVKETDNKIYYGDILDDDSEVGIPRSISDVLELKNLSISDDSIKNAYSLTKFNKLPYIAITYITNGGEDIRCEIFDTDHSDLIYTVNFMVDSALSSADGSDGYDSLTSIVDNDDNLWIMYCNSYPNSSTFHVSVQKKFDVHGRCLNTIYKGTTSIPHISGNPVIDYDGNIIYAMTIGSYMYLHKTTSNGKIIWDYNNSCSFYNSFDARANIKLNVSNNNKTWVMSTLPDSSYGKILTIDGKQRNEIYLSQMVDMIRHDNDIFVLNGFYGDGYSFCRFINYFNLDSRLGNSPSTLNWFDPGMLSLQNDMELPELNDSFVYVSPMKFTILVDSVSYEITASTNFHVFDTYAGTSLSVSSKTMPMHSKAELIWNGYSWILYI